MTDGLVVRFDDEGYRPARVARINYENGDYFSINASDDVKIDSSNGTALDPNQWNIQSSDIDHYIKMSIDSSFCAIEMVNTKDEVLNKYTRSMKDSLDVKVDYGKPHSLAIVL